MRTLLIIGAILLVAIGLIAFALINLNSLIASNKEQILQQVEQTLGREVEVQEIGVTVWGGIGARLTQFRITDDPAFSAEDFVRADALQVNVALWPLLSQEIQVRRLILRKPQIRLIRDEQGQFNFTSLTQTAVSVPEETAQKSEGTAPSPLLLLVALLDIQDGDIRYIDRQAGTDFRVTQLDIRAHDVSLDEPVRVELDAAVLSDQQNIALDVQAGPVGPGLDNVNTIPLEGAVAISQLDVNSLQQALPDIAQHIPPGLGISGPLNLKTDFSGRVGAVHLSNIEVQASIFDSSAPNVRVTGSFGPVGGEIPDPLAESAMNANVTLGPIALERLQQFGPVSGQLPPDLNVEGPVSVTAQASGTPNNLTLTSRVEASDSSIRFEELFNKPPGSALTLSTQARLTPKAIAFQEIKLSLHTLALTVSGNVGLDAASTLDLTIDSNRAELADLRSLLPLLQEYDVAGTLETHLRVAGPLTAAQLPQLKGTLSLQDGSASPDQLSKPVTDIQALVTLTGQGAELTDTTARIGESQLQLDAQIERLQPLKAEYELHAPVLRMADLQPEASEDLLEAIYATGQIWRQGEDLRHKGQLSSKQGSLAQVRYTDFQLDSSVANQVAQIDSFKLHALKGTIQGNGRYAFGAEQPHFAATAQVEALNLTEFFRSALLLTDPPVQGMASLDFKVSGSGQTWNTIKPTLQGQGKAEIVDGAVREFNLAEGVLSGLTGIPGLSLVLSQKVRDKYPAIFASPHTEFDELTSRFSLGNGKINLDSLRIAARDFMTQGKGWMDFEQRVDVTASLALSKALSADIIRAVKEMKYIANDEARLEVPFALAGVLPAVTPALDAHHIGTLIQRAATKALQDKVQEKIQDTILDKLLPAKKKAKQEDRAPQKPAGPDQTQPASEDQEKAPGLEELLIQKGLDSLFGR